ncbi:ParM/StbA family protein [Methylococcus sp. EFPC2]|uniref:ParM/StbA family protein n=1 Tax=Methylococcus sp. EFPC2 TaxID=2812648 RepID=UPI00196845BE|nr:ParM/StbA family protein [Methylococcus sp. EFPC2]QSA98124.1 ParM/StbA family protein [Methylococcus sp. EFPC2]
MFVLGMDIGYSNLKLAMGESGSPPAVSLYPAGAAPVDRLPESIGKEEDALRVSVDDDLWAACVNPGKFAMWNRALHQEYAQTASYRALFHASLLLAEHDTVDCLITGLPVSHWLERSRREAIVADLAGRHRVTPKREVEVATVRVVPQPIGGYLDLLWSRPGESVLEEGRVLIIDPGFFSVDWVLVEEGDIRKSSSGTSLEAMSVLLDHASRLMADEHGGTAPVERLEEALRARRDRVLLFGRPVDLQPYLEKAAERVAPVALEALRQSLRKESGSVDAVLLTGGGAALYEPVAQSLFPSNPIFVPDHPELANARGFYYFGAE